VARALATAALGVALCLGAATFDSPSLYVPGIALGVLAVGLVTWVRLAAYGASIERTPGPATVVEEDPYPLRLQVRSGLLPPPGGELLEPLLGWPVPIAGRWSRRVRINLRFARRGRRRLDPATLVIRDPLHLHTRELRGEGDEEVLVLPRVEPVVAAGGGGAGSEGLAGGDEGRAGSALEVSAAELQIDGLRPYRQGSPASRIHWPAFARTGEMLERRFVSEADSAPLVVLDASHPADPEALDKAVRAAASLCLHFARAGGCAVLLPGDRRPVEVTPELGGWPHLHARLALVEPRSGPPAASRAPRAAAVFWVSGGASGRAPRALDHLAATARYLVTPSPLGTYRTVFTVAGCVGQLLDRARRPGRGVAGRRAA
jgi:uncharacterized protein (DUF58 family)